MNPVVIWILIAVSSGSYNRGNLTVIARFQDPAACVQAATQLPTDGDFRVFCLPTRGAV